MNKYLIITGLVAGAYIVYKTSSAAQSVKEVVTEDLNPASDKNVINENIVSPLVRFATGGKHDSLGGALFCLFNPDAITCNTQQAATAQALDVSWDSEQAELLYYQEREFYEDEVL